MDLDLLEIHSMTPSPIERAREIWLRFELDDTDDTDGAEERLQKNIAAALTATIEECAKVAGNFILYDDPSSGTKPDEHEIAKAIRQLGQDKRGESTV